MATTNDGEAQGFSFQWKIENVSQWWWLKKYRGIYSPAFIADSLQGTKWSLAVFPKDGPDGNHVGLYVVREEDCSGPDNFQVHYQLSFLGTDGKILLEKNLVNHFMKNDSWGIDIEERERVFVKDKELFIPEDTLIVQCTMWITDKKPDKTFRMFATTVIKTKRRSFLWKIERIATLKSEKKYKFRDSLICFDVVLNKDFDRLYLDVTSCDEITKYISCKISILDSERKKENCEIKKYFESDLIKGILSSTLLFPEMVMENKSQYFPNDVLSLDFELVISTVEHLDPSEYSSRLGKHINGKEIFQNASVLIDDFRSLYVDGLFSDAEIRTSTMTFPVHKGILSARSPVFRNIFSGDMMEKSGHVDITDFEDDTVHRMLLYMYTDFVEDMHYESAFKLYAIADEFQIPSLKSKCSSFLEENLCPTDACDALSLAVRHHEDDLKSSLEDYILGQGKKVFCSQEWKDFMTSHVTLAADIMHRKISMS